jgi:hypothetical protein
MTMTPGALITMWDAAPYAYRRRIDRDTGLQTLVLVTEKAPLMWAIVQRHVGGWTCLTTGPVAEGILTPEDAATVIADLYDDGVDRMPRYRFAQTRPASDDIHLRRPLDDPAAYCGVAVSTPYDPVKGRYQQHCLKCTATYQAEHYGRLPLEA